MRVGFFRVHKAAPAEVQDEDGFVTWDLLSQPALSSELLKKHRKPQGCACVVGPVAVQRRAQPAQTIIASFVMRLY